MTELVKLDNYYINPKYLKCLWNVDNHLGRKATFLSLEKIDESDFAIIIDQPVEEVLKKLQKSNNFKIIE